MKSKLLVALSVFLSIAACSEGFCSPVEVGLPGKLTSLTDLGPVLRNQDMSAIQKTEVLIEWLRKEANNPSKDTVGIGGGAITSGYIQVQIVKSLREAGDLKTMDQVLTDAKANERVKDCVSITLALLGDRRQLPNMRLFLRQHKEPYLRAMAAEAIASLGDKDSMSKLRTGLNDTFKVASGSSLRVKSDYDGYPVRFACAEALRNLSDSDFVMKAEQRAQKFDERLAKIKH